MADVFKMDISDLLESLDRLGRAFDSSVYAYAKVSSEKLEGYAKENRPWRDRSTDARKRLNCKVEKTLTGYRLVLAHGVPYGVWLELAHEKKYAIIEPTINIVGKKEIMPGFKNLMDKLGVWA